MRRYLFVIIIFLYTTSAFADAIDQAYTAATALYWTQILQVGQPLLRRGGEAEVASVSLGYPSKIVYSVNLIWQARLTPDQWQMIFCHETGHVVGGAPYIWVNQDEGGVFSAEGQADYFAASKCLRRLWTDAADNARAVATFPTDLVRRLQLQGCSSDQCVRILGTAFTLLATISPDEPISIENRSTLVVSETQSGPVSPPAQCRFDTMLAGALCTIAPTVDFSPDNQRTGACVEGVGARPKCWFNPSSLDGRY